MPRREGMRGFYGEPSEGKEGIVGGAAKALVKELTGKPAEIVGTKVDVGEEPITKYLVYDRMRGTVLEEFKTEKEARNYIKDNSEFGDDWGITLKTNNERKGLSTQHSIEITPELKAAVEKGQPLFKEAEAQYRIESGKNIIEALKDFNGSREATTAITHEIMHPTVETIITGAKEGNVVGQKHTKTIVEEYNKANPDNKVTEEELIADNDKFHYKFSFINTLR